MCVFNGIKITLSEFLRLKDIVKQLKAQVPVLRIYHGYDYKDWPIVKPIEGDQPSIDVKLARWGFLPGSVYRLADVGPFQTRVFSLNAQAENLFRNEAGRRSMWADAARSGRCLILSSGFIEHRHIYLPNKKTGELRKTPETFPYWVTVKGKEYFYMAGIYNHWHDESSEFNKDTFAIVTTRANELMEQVHSSKKRMPTILTEDLAYKWIFGDLTDEQVLEIAAFQYPAHEMEAWPIDKKFKTLADPIAPQHYPELEAYPLKPAV